MTPACARCLRPGDGVAALHAVVCVNHEEAYKLLGRWRNTEEPEAGSSSPEPEPSAPATPSRVPRATPSLRAVGGAGSRPGGGLSRLFSSMSQQVNADVERWPASARDGSFSPGTTMPPQGGPANPELEEFCHRRQMRAHVITLLGRAHDRVKWLGEECRITAVHVTSESFSPSNKLQTPSMRLCRPNLIAKYSDVMDGLHAAVGPTPRPRHGRSRGSVGAPDKKGEGEEAHRRSARLSQKQNKA